MKAKTKGFWQTLENIPGLSAVEADWKARFGSDYKSGMKFLRPNGKVASSYPCQIPDGCGCYHDVINHSADDIVAVCRCGRECESFPLQRSDIAVYELNRLSLCNAIANAFNLLEETESYTNHPNTMLVGAYSPFAGFRFPVHFTIQLEADEFVAAVNSLISSIDKPFILMAPTRDLCSSQTEILLSNRKSAFVPIFENVNITENRNFQLFRPLDEIMSQFLSVNCPPQKDDISRISSQSLSEAISSNELNDCFTISHFKYDIRDCSDSRAAAEWAWKCLEDLAQVYCLHYCDGSKCSEQVPLREFLEIPEIEGPKKWVTVQKQFHEALAYLPELVDSDKCPACAVAEALSAFPLIIKHSNTRPVKNVVITELSEYPNAKNRRFDYRISIPCVNITTLIPGHKTKYEYNVREMAIYELDVSDLPPMPPDDLTEIRKLFLPGQKIVGELLTFPNNEENQKSIKLREHRNQAIVSAFALKDLIRIIYYYPDAISEERGRLLHEELTQYLENALDTEGLKPIMQLYEHPEYGDHSSESILAIVSGGLLISHPKINLNDKSLELISNAQKTILQECINNSSGQLKDIVHEIINIKVNRCMIPRPITESSFTEKGRFVQMFDHYWSLCKKVISFQIDFGIYSPDAIMQLMFNLRKRIDICFNELNSVQGVTDAHEAFTYLLDTCTSPNWDDLQAVPELTQGEIHKIDSFIVNSKLSLQKK